MDIIVILNQMIQLFLLIIIGYFLYKIDILTSDFSKKLTNFLLNVTMPALILSSVLQNEQRQPLNEVASVFLLSFFIYFILPFLIFIIIKLFRLPKHQQGLYMFMHTYSNIGFMGIPVTVAIYGTDAVFYAAIFNILFNISMYSIGLILINYGTSNKVQFKINNLKTPVIFFSVISILIYLFDINVPDTIANPITLLGNITTPVSMLLIGATLATMNIRSIFNDFHVYPFAVFKQLIFPILIWFLLHFIITNDYILGITIILISMPVGNVSLLFSTEYGNDEQLAAKTILITTLLSIITVPVIMYICF